MKKIIKTIAFTLLTLTAFQSCNKKGCLDPRAVNYNSKSTKDDGTCKYESKIFIYFNQKTASFMESFNKNKFFISLNTNDNNGISLNIPTSAYDEYPSHLAPEDDNQLSTFELGENDFSDCILNYSVGTGDDYIFITDTVRLLANEVFYHEIIIE